MKETKALVIRDMIRSLFLTCSPWRFPGLPVAFSDFHRIS